MSSTSTAVSPPSRRRFLWLAAAWAALLPVYGLAGCRDREGRDLLRAIQKTLDAAVPAAGVRLPFAFGAAIERLIAAGAIDPGKLLALYGKNGQPAAWFADLLKALSPRALRFSLETAPYLLDLLWPLGLSNKAAFNNHSPINGRDLLSYASTGGWTLGRAGNGSVYFNKVDALPLSPTQQAVALEIGQNTFRPCCDNATFFQDCNHGSALLGLIELAAFHGFSAGEIYRFALVANAYWFPVQYLQTALYFLIFEGRSWDEIPPELLLGRRFSSASGWTRNVNIPLRAANLVPGSGAPGGSRCGI
ncbi:MAG TPA: hypothetical protein VJ770_22480 [Stellaceae bacterium]|nr:hypothetical protein [Stellaceae bacterium]